MCKIQKQQHSKCCCLLLITKNYLSYLKDKWKCEKIFFYPGIQHGNDARGELFTKLTELGAVVRPKYFFTYKNEDKIATTNCPKCNTEITQRIEMGYSWKCNCDVELGVIQMAQ